LRGLCFRRFSPLGDSGFECNGQRREVPLLGPGREKYAPVSSKSAPAPGLPQTEIDERRSI
jgi:hypothetical protein